MNAPLSTMQQGLLIYIFNGEQRAIEPSLQAVVADLGIPWDPCWRLDLPARVSARVRADVSRSLRRLEARRLVIRRDRDGHGGHPAISALRLSQTGKAWRTRWVQLTEAGRAEAQRLTTDLVSRESAA